MPKSSGQKLKLLYLRDILLKRTDDNHGMTATEIIDALSEFNIKSERKSLYDDISSLQMYGLDIEKIGPKFENHSCFPNRTNTEFVEILDRKNVFMRVWERGTGETLACGTGCCATAVACVLNGLTDDEITVKLLGGELHIRWDRKANLVYMTGPAKIVFEGEVDPDSID